MLFCLCPYFKFSFLKNIGSTFLEYLPKRKKNFNTSISKLHSNKHPINDDKAPELLSVGEHDVKCVRTVSCPSQIFLGYNKNRKINVKNLF